MGGAAGGAMKKPNKIIPILHYYSLEQATNILNYLGGTELWTVDSLISLGANGKIHIIAPTHQFGLLANTHAEYDGDRKELDVFGSYLIHRDLHYIFFKIDSKSLMDFYFINKNKSRYLTFFDYYIYNPYGVFFNQVKARCISHTERSDFNPEKDTIKDRYIANSNIFLKTFLSKLNGLDKKSDFFTFSKDIGVSVPLSLTADGSNKILNPHVGGHGLSDSIEFPLSHDKMYITHQELELIKNGNYRSLNESDIPKIDTPLQPIGTSQAKVDAKNAARTLANYLWKQDVNQEIKIGEMAKTLKSFLVSTEHKDELPETAKSIEEWIKPIADKFPHSRLAGRPRIGSNLH